MLQAIKSCRAEWAAHSHTKLLTINDTISYRGQTEFGEFNNVLNIKESPLIKVSIIMEFAFDELKSEIDECAGELKISSSSSLISLRSSASVFEFKT